MKNKIKLLYITQSFGGVEIYIRQIIEYIDYTKFELTIIAPPNRTFSEYCKEKGIEYLAIHMVRGLNVWLDIKSFFQIRRIIKRLGPDIIHLHSSKAGVIGRIASKQLKKKSIFTPHGISYMSFSGLKRAIFLMVEAFTKKYTYKVLGCSYSEAIKMRFEVGIPSFKIDAIPNAILINSAIDKTFNKHADIIRIGSIARLTYQKNPLLLVQIAERIIKLYPNVRFSILGSGLEDHLKNETFDLIEQYGLSSKFEILPWGDRETSLQYLKSLNIFILTSIFEGLPLSLLEAMSLGTPCITSKSDGCNDVIQNNENGFSCIIIEEYVNAISRLIEDEILQKRIGENAHNFVKEHHNIESYIRKIESYYERIYSDS
ncbi:MAG: glycosyltransferase [Prevotella sp.]|jgi:glycosyltransferase involved in cell wall biosynthesis|nr:glycosyltransferase [Prevotella sp.]